MPSSSPTAEFTFGARVFNEPLIPVGSDPTAAENAALSTALQEYTQRPDRDDFSSVTAFLTAHPRSPWALPLMLNLGLAYFHSGHYSKALGVWEDAWDLAKLVTARAAQPLTDRIVGELAYMYARLGRKDDLQILLDSLADHVFSGPATELICGAREGLWTMNMRPDVAFRCGPLALHRIKQSVDPHNPRTDVINATASTPKGFNLHQVAKLSGKLGLDYQMAFRAQHASIIVPSVAHFRLDHFAAVIRQEGDLYLLEDPTFGGNVMATGAALDEETSGYFLIPQGDLPRGWRAVDAHEGEQVWGKGVTTSNDPKPHGPCDPHTSGGGSSCNKDSDDCKGMAVARVHLMLVSLNIIDEPVGYAPAFGPEVRFRVRYSQREAAQPSTGFHYSNLGYKWTFDWLAYIVDKGSSNDVDYYIMGGGVRTFGGFDPATKTFAVQQLDQTRLTRTSADSYEMVCRDGSKRIFAESDKAFQSRKVFLTQVIDPFGNAVTLEYQSVGLPSPQFGRSLRIVKIFDATGPVTGPVPVGQSIAKVTTIFYDNPDPFKITKVTDPFGRSAHFRYDLSGRLVAIVDVMGHQCTFSYDLDGADGSKSDFIVKLITPYGTTTFSKTEPGNTRSLKITYPDGNSEYVEFNQTRGLVFTPGGSGDGSEPPHSVPGGMATDNDLLTFRNTFYWDRQAFAHAANNTVTPPAMDYAKARIYHWLHVDQHVTAGILESFKAPLENRVWYDYDGQGSVEDSSIWSGSTNKPAHVGRVLDDGSTQIYTYEYNEFGNVTKTVDPVGRTMSYGYDPNNGIDLLEVRQTRAGQSELLSATTYNDQHLPVARMDAAGQTTKYEYNSFGQITKEIKPNGDTTEYLYKDGLLTTVKGPLAGASITIERDEVGRIHVHTDSDGYSLAFEYDNLDRIRKITYPDNTFATLGYTGLDRTSVQDRAGRVTLYEYNPVRQLSSRTDPLNRKTLFEWCKCGALRRLTDPMGRTTTWFHDLQGRIKSKVYPDGSTVSYRYEATTSRLRQRIDEKLQVTQYNYYRDGTLREISYANVAVPTPHVTFTYDANYERVSSMTDGTGTTFYTYHPIRSPFSRNGAGKLASIVGQLPNSKISYEYDELGRRNARKINEVSSVYAKDAANRLFSESNIFGSPLFRFHAGYTYDGASPRLATITHSSLVLGGRVGPVTRFSYADVPERRLQQISHVRGQVVIPKFIYSYDTPTGRISTWTQVDDGISYTLGYDDADQLKTAVADRSGNSPIAYAYGYDLAGNRLSEQIGSTTTASSYNSLNQLTTVANDSAAPSSYEWDGEQRLTAIITGEQRTEFSYDGVGRRVGLRQTVSGTEVANKRYLWSDSEICEERTSDGSTVKHFLPWGVVVNSGPQAVALFYTRDHLGSIRELTDIRGTVHARYTYDPFGRRTRVAGDIEADFGFAGMFVAMSLHPTLFRVYDSNVGRWASRDPLRNVEFKEGPNVYGYVANDPINRTDLRGLQAVGPKAPPPPPVPPAAPGTTCQQLTKSIPDPCFLICLLGTDPQLQPLESLIAEFANLGCDCSHLDTLYTVTWVECQPPPRDPCVQIFDWEEVPSPCNPAPVCEEP